METDPTPVTEEEDAVEKAIRVTKELKAENDRQEAIVEAEKKLLSSKILAGDGGGHIAPKTMSPEDKKKAAASDFFKGTALGDAIDKQ